MDIYIWQIVLIIIVIVATARFVWLSMRIGMRDTLKWYDPLAMAISIISFALLGTYLFYQLVTWLISAATDFLSFKVRL